jgi:ligand-binding sensor domain-containing protein
VKHLFGLFVILWTQLTAVGQQPSYFLFGEKEFEGVDIYDLIQDNAFNYVFATNQGIVLHDGYSFENISCSKMKSSSVFNFVKDENGILYCHNLNHQIFKIEKGICSLFFEIPEKGKGADITIHVTKENNLLVISKIAYLLNQEGNINASSEGIAHNYIGQPFQLDDGTIICSDAEIPYVLVLKNGKFYKRKLKLTVKETFSNENNLFNFHKIGRLTYAVNIQNQHFYRFNQENFELSLLSSSTIPFAKEYVRYYTQKNYLWVASNVNGLAYYDANLQVQHKSQKIYTDYFISNVFQDQEGNLLLSTFNQGVLVIPNLQTEDKLEIFNPFSVSKLISDTKNNLFLGTQQGEVLAFQNKKLHVLSSEGNKAIETLYKWPNKPFLLSDIKGLSILNVANKSTFNLNYLAFKCALERDSNSLYIGSNIGLGVLTYRPKTKSFDYEALNQLTSRCYSIQRDAIGKQIYVGTIDGIKIIDSTETITLLKRKGEIVYGNILGSFQNKTYIYTRSNELLILKDGKIIDVINPRFSGKPLKLFKIQIYHSKIYANTNKGFVIMNADGLVEQFINKSSGLAQNKIIDFNMLKDTIWICHSKGVQFLPLSKIKSTLTKPLLQILEMKVNNQKIRHRNLFKASENKFTFELKVPTLKNRENIYYYTQLEPVEKGWTINHYPNHTITFSALSPGNYTFKVKAENNGRFSDTIVYTFKIQAPFYQRWWFNLIIGTIFFMAITFIYKNKLKKQKLKSDLINELNASKLIAIQSQMNPHFIFNSMNSIQDLVLKGDISNSYTYITKFSNLVRKTLNYSDKEFIDFEQEIKLLELYLSLEKLRFKESLTYTIDIQNIEDIQIPPMLIQPFIENALLHGLLHKEGNRKLGISFQLKETLICEITDNGIGREKSKEIKSRQLSEHESFAVGAIKNRFEILTKHYPGSLGFHYEDLIDNNLMPLGTKVTISIPFKPKF